MLRSLWFFALILGLAFIGCKTSIQGELNPNKAPETFTVVDTIARAGQNRYTSQVEIKWWGQDQDGYVASYQISFDGINWITTQSQDSVFNLNLPPGSDTADFSFQVRAIDNNGAPDPTPASLVYPVKNSTPSASFFESQAAAGNYSKNPTISFPILKFNFQCADPDGSDNLDHLEFCLNDTSSPPYSIPANITSITIWAKSPGATTSNCWVYTSNSTTPLSTEMTGLLTNASNTLFIRAVDKVGATSNFQSASPIWVKRVQSSVLMVNAYKSTANKSQVQSFYANALTNAGISTFDTLQATEIVNNNYTQLSPDNLTQTRIFSLFKHIIWFTDDADFSLSLGQKTTADFFKNGGTFFMAVGFSSNIDPQANYLDFTPIKNLVPQPQGQTFRLVSGTTLTAQISGFPNLQVNASPFIARPLFKQDDGISYTYNYLYNGTIKISGSISKDWTHPDSTNLMIMRSPVGNSPDFIISGIPIEKLDGSSNSGLFFQEALINRLKFK